MNEDRLQALRAGAGSQVRRGYWQPDRSVLSLTKSFFFYWYCRWEAFETFGREQRSKVRWPIREIPGLNVYARSWRNWSSFCLVHILNPRLCPSRFAFVTTRATADIVPSL